MNTVDIITNTNLYHGFHIFFSWKRKNCLNTENYTRWLHMNLLCYFISLLVILSITIFQYKICEIRRESSNVFHKIYDVFQHNQFFIHCLHHNLGVAINTHLGSSHRNCFQNCLTNRFPLSQLDNLQSLNRRHGFHNYCYIIQWLLVQKKKYYATAISIILYNG